MPFEENKHLLATLDIVSLYTQIPQDDGLAVLTTFLESRVKPTKVPTDFIMQLATFAIKKNYFMFKYQFYYQIKGVAMGCPFASELAVLFMST